VYTFLEDGPRIVLDISGFSAPDGRFFVYTDLQSAVVGPEMFLVGTLEKKIIATIMAGYEGHRDWLNYLAVAPEYRGRGLARLIVAAAEALLKNAGCPKINLQVRASNQGVIEFYKRIGYAVDDVVSMGKRLESDDPAQDSR
jgi:ribosomal protein S18 acetylase RimI-like enzyme